MELAISAALLSTFAGALIIDLTASAISLRPPYPIATLITTPLIPLVLLATSFN